jgi:hypothetical protein
MTVTGLSSSSRPAGVVFTILLAVASAEASPARTLTPFDAGAIARARAGALRKLADPECRKVFTDFTDGEGRSLRQNLDAWAEDTADYVALIPFLDGSKQKLCRAAKTALVAQPGVRRVYVCKAFADFQLKQPGIAESMVIHEILHTLGLGENPPSSIEITQRIESRCR